MKHNKPRPDRSIAGFERAAAWISFYAGGLFVLLLVGLHVIEPEYDPTWRSSVSARSAGSAVR